MNDVVKFEDAVKARIKDIVADLIPEERWTAMVDFTVNEFIKTDLPKLVKEELTVKYKKLILEELDKPDYRPIWSNVGPECSEAVKQAIIDAAPTVLAGLIGSSMQNIIYQFQQNMKIL